MSSSTTVEKEDVKRIMLGFALDVQKQIPFNFQKRKRRVIVIAGPTASGKSALAMTLAELIGGEIVSADSMQVYRGMDIGTAKPTKEQRLLIPHHLIDTRDVTESFNVVDFYYEARQACQLILDRDNVPIVVGGSGFYLHALLYGPPSGPPSIPELRKSLEEEMSKVGSEVLYERLQEKDPLYARTITKNDKQKIVRALEIMALTGKKVSKLSWKGRRKTLNYDFHCWFLHRPKDVLYKRIEDRCDRMLDAGFLDEVRTLEEAGIWKNSSAVQAIGYRQALDYLKTSQTPEEYRHFVSEFKKASRQYAKRQYTWFRKEPLFRWIDMELHDDEIVMDIIMKDYEMLL